MKHITKRMPRILSAISLITIAFSPAIASAQYFPYFENMGPFLNNDDFASADVATRKLMEPEPAALGTVATWRNPASGNSGILTMGRAYEKDGNPCRTVSWHVAFQEGHQHTVLLDTCRIKGIWKLM
jgi:surface antigen